MKVLQFVFSGIVFTCTAVQFGLAQELDENFQFPPSSDSTPYPSIAPSLPSDSALTQTVDTPLSSALIVTEEIFEQKVPGACPTNVSPQAIGGTPLQTQIAVATQTEVDTFINTVVIKTDDLATETIKDLLEITQNPAPLEVPTPYPAIPKPEATAIPYPLETPSPLPTETALPTPAPKPSDSPKPPKRCCACVSYKNGYYPDYGQFCSGYEFNKDCDVGLRYTGQVKPPTLPSALFTEIQANECTEVRVQMYHHGDESMCKPLMENVLGCLQAIQKHHCTGQVQIVNHGCEVFANKQGLKDAATQLAANCPTGMSCTVIGHGSNALLPSPENVAYQPLCEADGDGFCNVPAITVKVENQGNISDPKSCLPTFGLPLCSSYVGIQCEPGGQAIPYGQAPCTDADGKAKVIQCSGWNGTAWTWKIVGDWIAK